MKEYLIDTHAHIDMLEAPIELTLQLMNDFGVKKAVIPSVEVSSMEKVIAAAEADENIYAMIGIYPSEAKTYTQEVEDRMIELAKNHKVKAVGEIGLDYYWDEPERSIQKKWFEAQIELARDVKLPIIIHSRDAAKDTYDIMKALHAEEIGEVVHCFSYSKEMARQFLDMGFYIGIGGVLTFKNAKKLVRCAERIPLSSIVLETDCPYMAPEPNRGKRNDSSQLIYVAQKLAEIKGITAEEVKQVTTENAHRLYRLTQNK